PLSESATISKELGTRHRAALGVSEVTDALTIIVSEETGAISFTKNGELTRDVDEKQLEDMLMKNLTQSIKNADTNLLDGRCKKNGYTVSEYMVNPCDGAYMCCVPIFIR